MKSIIWSALVIVVFTSGCDSSREDLVQRDPIFDAPPVSQDILDRVLAEPEDVPQRQSAGSGLDSAFDGLGDRLGQAIEDAADRPQSSSSVGDEVRVILFTADWCTWCRPAKEKGVPWLQSLGYTVEISDVTRPHAGRQSFPIPRSLPTWVFFRNGREVYRQEGGYLPEHLQKAVKAVPLSKAPTVGAWFGPTLRVADALPLVAGMSLKLGKAATVTVPADLKWTVSNKPGVVVLSFDPAPQVTVHKILNWRVRLEGIEITPTSITLQIDNLPDVTVKFDWTCPQRASDADVNASDDLHRASTSLRRRPDRPVLRFIGRSVLFTYRVCSIASFVLFLV